MNEKEVAKKLMGLRETSPIGAFADGEIVVSLTGGLCPFRAVGNYCLLVRLANTSMHCGASFAKPPECPLREGPVTVRMKDSR